MFCKFFCCILSWSVLISFREAIMLNNEIILKVPAINKYKRNEKEIIMFRRTTYHLYFGSVQVQWQGLPIQANKWNWCGTNNKFGSPKKANLHETSLHFINIHFVCYTFISSRRVNLLWDNYLVLRCVLSTHQCNNFYRSEMTPNSNFWAIKYWAMCQYV